MTWLTLALSAVGLFTVLNLLQRVLATESKDQRAMTIIFNMVAGVIAVAVFVAGGSYKNFSLPADPNAYIFLGVAVLSFGLFERGRFVAAKLLDASTLTTISTVSVLVAFVGAALLYQEPMSLQKLAGGILIILALVIVSLGSGGKRKISLKGVLAAALIWVFLGIGWMMDKSGATHFNADTYSFLVWTLPLFVVVFPGIKIKTLKTEMKLASWKVFLLAGINVAGYLMQLKAVAISDATKVIPIVQLSTFATVIAGIIFLKEKENLLPKILGSILAVIGSVLLV